MSKDSNKDLQKNDEFQLFKKKNLIVNFAPFIMLFKDIFCYVEKG